MDRADAQGRLKDRNPVAIIDIGSNSVRLVIFEGLVRSPAALFNEKVSCELGRGIANTGRMNDDGVEKALRALTRFKRLAAQAEVSKIFVLATAAAREAENGPDFVAAAEAILQTEIQILTGKEEAYYSAYGIISAFSFPDGVVGDLGGGSLELIDVRHSELGDGITLPLGVIRLEERAEANMKAAQKIAKADLETGEMAAIGAGRPFYAVGGTWRNLAKLHMAENDYPLHITHAYRCPADDLLALLEKLIDGKVDDVKGIEEVSRSRRALLPYGALVLKNIITSMKPSEIVFSAYGVREGFIFAQLSPEIQRKDALLIAAHELATLRARSPRHSAELADWTADCFVTFDINETVDERRYRQAACHLADIGWRAHPDYRAAQSLAIIAYGNFVQISHQGRAYIALANYFRYQGLKSEQLAPEIKHLTTDRIWYRAKVLGAFFRVGYLFTAAMPGILKELSWEKDGDTVKLIVPKALEELIGERPQGRVSQLSKVLDTNIDIEVR